MRMELAGKVAVVTGASSGLGRRFAWDMARSGAIVTGLARRADLLESLSKEMQVSSPDSTTLVCDVSDVDGYTATLCELERHHGRIDVLINNAGVGGSGNDLALHRRLMELNYFAVVAGTLAVLPGMQSRGSGVVVNVSSDSGRAPTPDETAYSATKAALSMFTESLAFSVEGTGVHLHVLYPGWVPTGMGQGAVDDGMSKPPRMVRRTEEQVSNLLLSRMGGPKVDIDATLVARLAPVARTLFPSGYRRGVRKATTD